MIKLIVIVPLIALLIVLLINELISSLWLDNTIKNRFLNNKELFETTRQICLKEKIGFIGDSENPNLENQVYNMISGYYVYADEALSDDIQKELKGMLTKLKRYRFHSIYVNDNRIAFAASNFFKSIMLVYTEENESVESIIKSSFCREARYIDDNWYITVD